MYHVKIVEMKPEHIEGVLHVENQSFSIPWSKKAFMEELTNNKFARYLAALVDEMIVGYAGMWKVFDEGHITNIAVLPEFRGNGVGSLLLEGLIKIAQNEQIARLTLEVRKSNLIAQGLYNKYGFVIEGLRKNYYADNYEDAVIMWKHETGD